MFDTVYTVDVKGSTNRELFASNDPQMLETLTAQTASVENEQLRELLTKVADNCEQYVAGNYIMTDDQAPVELLGMRVLDQVIGEEVAYYKGIYEREGICGLLDHI